MKKTYRRVTQRSEALPKEWFAESVRARLELERLESRIDKSHRQWKIDRRIAHAIRKRLRRKLWERSKLGYFGIPEEYNSPLFVKRMRNRVFRVSGLKEGNPYSDKPSRCQLDRHPMRSTPWWEMTEYNFNQRYYPDRYELDKQQGKRGKN